MLIDYHLGQGSIVLRVKLRQDTTGASPGKGFTGATSSSTGLKVSTIADNEGTATTYTSAGSTIETIATLGTFVTPTATKCRIKEVDATNHPGVVELQIDNARYAVSSAKSLMVSITGISGLMDCDVLVPLRTIDPYSASFGITSNIPADAKAILGTSLTETTGGNLAGAFKKVFDVASGSLAFTAACVNQSGDAYAYVVTTLAAVWTKLTAWVLGADHKAVLSSDETGSGLSAVPDTAGTTTLLARLTAARADYMDNLNVGGALASHADISAINTSASKHMTLATVGQYVPGETYTVEMRTYNATTGAAVNADTTPTVTPIGNVSGDLSANLSVASNPATGVYRWTYTPGATPTLEQIRMDGSTTISSSTFTLSAYTQTVDEATVVWTATDQAHLTAVYNKLPTNNIADETLVLAAISPLATETNATTNKSAILTAVGSPMQAGSSVTVGTNNDKTGYSLTTAYDGAKTAAQATALATLQTAVTAIAAVLSGITSLGNWLRSLIRSSTPDATALSEINTTGGTYAPSTMSTQYIAGHLSGGGSGSDAGLDDINDTATYPSGTLAGAVREIKAKTDMIVGGVVQFSNAVGANLKVTVKRRHDFNAIAGNALSWPLKGNFRDLSGATIQFVAQPGPDARDAHGAQITGQINVSGVVDTASGASQQVHVDLTAADLTVTASPYWRYDLNAIYPDDPANVVVLASQVMDIQQDYAP